MVRLRQNPSGSYSARKRLPDDVRAQYAHDFGPSLEAKFSAPAGTAPAVAKRLFNKWLSDVETRIATIRAQLRGEGISLTRKQVRALAGEWYDWFFNRHPEGNITYWEHLQERVSDALQEAGGQEWFNAGWEPRPEEPDKRDEMWWDEEDLRKAVRPVLADVAETAQFLHSKQMVLDKETLNQFLDDLYLDLSAALKRIKQQSRVEPLRVLRRPVCLSQAANAGSSSMA